MADEERDDASQNEQDAPNEPQGEAPAGDEPTPDPAEEAAAALDDAARQLDEVKADAEEDAPSDEEAAALAAVQAAIAGVQDAASPASAPMSPRAAAREAAREAAQQTAQQAPPVVSVPGGAMPFEPPAFSAAPTRQEQVAIDLLGDVNLHVTIELGRTRMLVEDVLRLGEGAVVELDKLAGDPVDVHVNGRLVARGEVLVLNDAFCVRVNEILDATAEHATDA